MVTKNFSPPYFVNRLCQSISICEYRGFVLKNILGNVLFTMHFRNFVKNIQKKVFFCYCR